MTTVVSVRGTTATVRLATAAVLVSALAVGLAASAVQAHVSTLPLGGKKLQIKADGAASKRKFSFKSEKGLPFPIGNPVDSGASLIVFGDGLNAGHTGNIQLDPNKWKIVGDPDSPEGAKAYIYKDKDTLAGGVKKLSFKRGSITIIAKGANWPWSPAGAQDSVGVRFVVGQEGDAEFEAYCAHFGGDVKKNDVGVFQAKSALPLASCPTDICGDGIVTLGEECDDGNLVDTDGCNADCTIGECTGSPIASTYEAIQTQIFNSPVYSCTSSLCHDAVAPGGGLDLTAGVSHANLVSVASQGSGAMLERVVPGDKDQSFLYEKLEAGVNGTTPNGGSSMPTGGQLTLDHLEAVRLWIQGGAPETGVVAGTETLFDGCLPEATPLTIPVPDPPGAGVGVQVWSNPWDLPSQFENEVCFATYYDFRDTGLIPETSKVSCPTVCENSRLLPCATNADCGGNECIPNNPLNEDGECFRFHINAIHQDPQSHHLFTRAYLGQFDETHGGWGSWTYKFQDKSNPLQDQPCDPAAIDPALGYNPGCSSTTVEAISCLGMGPPDLSQGASVAGATGSGTTPTFGGAGTPVAVSEFADGVYGTLPMQGIFVWNSHAFNLTSEDTTMSAYMNLVAATPADQVYGAQGIFDPQAIFVQDVPPFQTREYCRAWTAPQGARVYLLTSHTHQWGVRWRTWAPPNTPCGTSCVPSGDTPTYISTEYTDPLNLRFDDPLEYDSPNAEDRTFLYCSLYDNGSTPTSPGVKRQSTSVEPPTVFGLPLGPGGPCNDFGACTNNGPTKNDPCLADVECDSSVGAGDGVCNTGNAVQCLNVEMIGELCGGDDSACDTSPGAGDGVCDACPVRGGVTTTDEMFILQGGMYVVPVGP